MSNHDDNIAAAVLAIKKCIESRHCRFSARNKGIAFLSWAHACRDNLNVGGEGNLTFNGSFEASVEVDGSPVVRTIFFEGTFKRWPVRNGNSVATLNLRI